MKEIRSLRPKNLARKRVACRCDSEDSIHCRHDLRGHVSLHPFRSTRQPLQLILISWFWVLLRSCFLFSDKNRVCFMSVLYLQEWGQRRKGRRVKLRSNLGWVEFGFVCKVGSFTPLLCFVLCSVCRVVKGIYIYHPSQFSVLRRTAPCFCTALSDSTHASLGFWNHFSFFFPSSFFFSHFLIKRWSFFYFFFFSKIIGKTLL